MKTFSILLVFHTNSLQVIHQVQGFQKHCHAIRSRSGRLLGLELPEIKNIDQPRAEVIVAIDSDCHIEVLAQTVHQVDDSLTNTALPSHGKVFLPPRSSQSLWRSSCLTTSLLSTFRQLQLEFHKWTASQSHSSLSRNTIISQPLSKHDDQTQHPIVWPSEVPIDRSRCPSRRNNRRSFFDLHTSRTCS